MANRTGELRELALFAGAGGGILGGMLLGWQTMCAVEINSFCARRLMQRQNEGHLPPFPIWDDVCTFRGSCWRGHIDVVSGGFPCQAWSTASAGRHASESLWPEMLRIIGEVCPRYVFSENVDEGAIVSAQKDLSEAGYATCRVLFAAGHIGADHPRKRWWLVADADNKGKLGSNINAEMAIKQTRCDALWKTIPGDPRVVNGMAHRMDRYAAIGNGQVPAVVKAVWKTLVG